MAEGIINNSMMMEMCMCCMCMMLRAQNADSPVSTSV